MARILVIDDARGIRKMVGLTLRQAEHEVSEAAGGALGLETFGDGQTWDLTLIDQQMNGVQGREVIAEARKRDPTARLIMMTAFATPELAGDALEAGAVDFLRKPFSTQVLRGAVQDALSRPRHAAGFSVPVKAQSAAPVISFAVNGFDFWSLTPLLEVLPPGIEISRTFFVCDSQGASRHCLVVVAPHVGEQVRQETQRTFAAREFLWDKVCDLALSDYLFQRGQLPPPLLPVFELTPTQLFTVRKLAGRRPFLDG